MITLNFNVRNPWSDRWKCIKSWAGTTPFRHKFWEVQIDKTSDIIGFDLRLTTRQDHAGLFLCLAFLGYEIIITLYDHRHWDTENNRWSEYREENLL